MRCRSRNQAGPDQAGPDQAGPDQAGTVGAEALPLIVLVFLGGTLMFVGAWTVIDAKIIATAGAQQAVRSFVEHPGSNGADPVAAAVEAGQRAMSGYGPPGRAKVRPVGATRLRRCARASFEATIGVPRVAVFSAATSVLTVRARASEIVDPFRHGLNGNAPC